MQVLHDEVIEGEAVHVKDAATGKLKGGTSFGMAHMAWPRRAIWKSSTMSAPSG